ncbi:MAG: hypothetical protein ACFFCV_07160 [Promethearchaeota archaeon]
MTKLKQIVYKNALNKISRKTALKVNRYAKLPFEKCYNWIPAGSQGTYRENCNKKRYELQCEHDPHSKKSIYQHCNKLDCEVCFITACSIKARKINDRLKEFRRICYVNGIGIGKIMHFSIAFHIRQDTFETYQKYTEFKRKIVYPMLKDIGVLGGVIFLHLWSNVCTQCNEKEYFCKCTKNDKTIEKKIHVHIHVVGFGYLMNNLKFREKYPNATYRNHLPRRNNVYYTIFYILSKIALWKDRSGLKSSYNLFGYLHQSKFMIQGTYNTRLTDNCPICKTPRHICKIEHVELHNKRIWTIKTSLRKYKLKDIEVLRQLVSNNYTVSEMKILQE